MSFKGLVLGLIVISSATAVLYWQKDKLPFSLPELPHQVSLPALNQVARNPQLNTAAQQAQEQLQATGEKFQDVSGNVQKVMGAAIQVNENETKTAPEKALDYGKYLYCKQVVADYEKQVASPKPSPKDSPSP